MSSALKVFISYTHKDEEFRQQLEEHLALHQRLGEISTWHDRKIPPGKELAKEIDRACRFPQERCRAARPCVSSSRHRSSSARSDVVSQFRGGPAHRARQRRLAERRRLPGAGRDPR